MTPHRIAIIGFGKIAVDQHVPSIAAEPRLALVAGVSTRPVQADVTIHADVAALMRHRADFDAVAICTPPGPRFDIAVQCIEAGLAVLLEKPPAATLGEAERLVRLAADKRVPLFTTWHSQHNAAVEQARSILTTRPITSLRIDWREDVRKWHPGQAWIWEAGAFGVFDPGINALSIAERIVPAPLLVRSARLDVPANRQAPIAATATLTSPAISGRCEAVFDWRHEAGESWTITAKLEDGGTVELRDGGKRLIVDGTEAVSGGDEEYRAIYRRFADLIQSGESDIDLEPLRLVADIFLRAERYTTDPFSE